MLKVLLKRRKIKFPKAKIKEYKDVFNLLDKNKKGIISVNDFLKMKSIFSYPIGCEEIEEMVKEINKKEQGVNGDLDFKAFIELMKKQIQYIDENDEDMIFRSFKEQFKNELLGRKRKREIIYSYENSKIENESEISNYDLNTKNSIEIEKSKLNFNLADNKSKKPRSKDFNTQINIFSKLKNINIMIPREVKENNKNDLGNKNYIINNKITKKESENRLKENSKQKMNLKTDNESKNTLEIYKRSLSKELVSQIESKDNTKNPINKRLNSRKNNNYFQNKKTKSSSRNNSRYNYRKSKRSNSKNKLNICLPKKSPYSGYSINSRLDRTPLINVQKKKKNLVNNCSDNILSEIKEKLINKGIKTKKSKRKNSKKKNIQAHKLRKIVNKNFYGPNSNYKDLISSLCSSDNITTENKSLILNEIELKKDKSLNMSKDITSVKVPEKIINKNIILLYNFELEYATNKQKEKIVKRASEVPYSIIIEKIALNLEIQKFFQIKKNLIKSPYLDSNNNKNELNSSDINNSKSNSINNKEKNENINSNSIRSNEDKANISNNLIKEKVSEKKIKEKKGKKKKEKKSKSKKKVKQITGKETKMPIVQETKSSAPLDFIENKQMNKNKNIKTDIDKNNSKEMKNSSENNKNKKNINKNTKSKANSNRSKNSNKNANTNNNRKTNINTNQNKSSNINANNINNKNSNTSMNNEIINKKGNKIRIKWC